MSLIDAIFSDIDGTVIGKGEYIPPSFLRAYDDLKVPVHFATGRSYGSAMAAFKKLGLLERLKPTCGVYCDGSVIMGTSEDQILREVAFDASTVLLLTDWLSSLPQSDDWGMLLTTRKTLFHLRGKHIPFLDRVPDGWTTQEISSPNEIWDDYGLQVLYISLLGKKECLRTIREFFELSPFALDARFIIKKDVMWLNHISLASVNKGEGVQYLCDLLSYDEDRVVVIGDQYNDVEMLESFKNSIAMGNAPNFVKSSAKYSTNTCEEDGWAMAMQCHVEGTTTAR